MTVVISGSMRALALVVLVVSSMGGLVSRAHAQNTAEARRLFEEGIDRADQERWGEAVELFRRSRAIVERPSTVFNLGNALFRLARYQDAVRAFEDFLRIAEASDADGRRSAQQLMETARRSLGRLVLTLSPGEAEVRIDGQVVDGSGATREITIDPGEHTLAVRAPGRREATSRVSVLPGARVEQRVELAVSTEVTAVPRGPARLTITSNVSGATILLDGDEVGSGTASEEVEPGRHTIEVTADGHRSFRRVVNVRRGAALEVQATLERIGGDEGGGVFSSPVFWIVSGLVVAGAATGAILAVTMSGESDPARGSTGVVLMGLHAN